MSASIPPPGFVIVRHGNTFAAGEPPRRIGSRTDLPLTDAGRAQADALGAHFAAMRWRFARVLTSPLLRTRDTAAAILRHLPYAPAAELADWLREIDHGPDEDQPEPAVLARIGAEALAAWDSAGVPPPGWTVDAELRLAAWRELFGQDDGPVLLVTSNGAARFALLAAGLPGSGTLKLPTGSFGALRRQTGGALQVECWGVRP
jgi:probable phosphoglycerate mutase